MFSNANITTFLLPDNGRSAAVVGNYSRWAESVRSGTLAEGVPSRCRASSLYLRDISMLCPPTVTRAEWYSSMCPVLTMYDRWMRRNRLSSCDSHCEMRVLVR